nr:acyl carrier protein [Streptomyces chartreusis]
MSNTDTNTLEILKELIGEVSNDPVNQIGLDTSFTDDLHLDSLAIVSLLVLIERTFDVRIPDNLSSQLSTVGHVVVYLEQAEKVV